MRRSISAWNSSSDASVRPRWKVRYLSMSCHWRWPGVWSMNETSFEVGLIQQRLEHLDHMRVRHLAAQMQEMLGA